MSYIYLLSNESMPGILKVGCTERFPSQRALELYSTGVPTPFHVEAYWKINNHDLLEVEQDVHKLLSKHRIHHKREFFKHSVHDAREIISNYLSQYDELEKKRIKCEKEEYEEKQQAAEIKRQKDYELSIKSKWEIDKNKYFEKANAEAEKVCGIRFDVKCPDELLPFYAKIYNAIIGIVLWAFIACTFGIGLFLLGKLGIDPFIKAKEVDEYENNIDVLRSTRDRLLIEYRRNHFINHNVKYPYKD